MINYIIQVLLFQTLFLAVYDLLLKKETFFQWNRFYLIISSVLAYLIPFIKIKSVGEYVQQEYVLPEILISPKSVFLNEVSLNKTVKQVSYFTLENLYLFGFVLMSLLFLIKITQIIKKIHTNKVIKKPNYNLVITNKDNAFSFFNYVFLGETVYKKEHLHILKHELTHVKQKHSLDLLFFEIQKIVFWFNPFSYLFQNRISTLHEYIADDETISEKDKGSFFENLLQQTFSVEKITFVNNYYKQSLLKKRIIMATKNKSKQILKMKYLLVLPLLLVMLIYTSCNTKIEENVEIENVYKFIDLDEFPYLANTKETDNEKRKMELITELITISFDNVISKDIKTLVDDSKPMLIKFIIDKNGNSTNFNYDEIPEELKEEAKKLVKLIPKINAGIKDGKTVNSKLIMTFVYENSKKSNNGIIPFSQIDKTPIFPGCEKLTEDDKIKECLQISIANHISENFDTNLAQNLGLSLGKKRISVQFLINKDGIIEDVKSRAPHPKLEEEAIRIIKLLPQMQAGEENGKKVKVRYNLPITFNVEK